MGIQIWVSIFSHVVMMAHGPGCRAIKGSDARSGASGRNLGGRRPHGISASRKISTTTNAVANSQSHPSHHITEIEDPGRDWNLHSAPTTNNTPSTNPTRCLTTSPRRTLARVRNCAYGIDARRHSYTKRRS